MALDFDISEGYIRRNVVEMVLTFVATILIAVIVSLIPGRVQSGGFAPVVLTYANLLNGIFGLYVGSALSKLLTRHFSRTRTLALMFGAGITAMLILKSPVFPVAMIIVR